MTGWLREPLLHFTILGSLIFGVAEALAPDSPAGRVVIDASRVAARYARQTGAAPDDETLRALIDREVERALLFQEAQALGLADGDEIVRRRLVQKMTLVLDEAVRPPDPDDATLAEFLASHPRRFAKASRRALTHVFFRTGDAPADEALAAVVDALERGAAPEAFGAPFPRGRRIGLVSENELGRIVDPDFARVVFSREGRGWFGPVTSTYGRHLVRVDERRPGRVPALARVRDSVALAWRERELERRRKQALDLLRDKYTVEVKAAP